MGFSAILQGSLPFIAPERANLEPYDKNIDYYSAGVIFSMILGLKHPYFHLLCDQSLNA